MRTNRRSFTASQNGRMSSVIFGLGLGFVSIAAISIPPENKRAVRRAHSGREDFPAMAGDETDLSVGNLALAGFAAELRNGFRHVSELTQVIAGQEPAAGID